MKEMVAESKRRLPMNTVIFLLTLWCHYSLKNISFCDSDYVILYP